MSFSQKRVFRAVYVLMTFVIPVSSFLQSAETTFLPSNKRRQKGGYGTRYSFTSIGTLHQSAASEVLGSSTSSDSVFPRISTSDIETLSKQGYVIIPNFLSADLVSSLREDVTNLRTQNKFNVARIGQDSTNTLNTDIRIAETCFLGKNKPELVMTPNEPREFLYQILDTVREDLSGNSILDVMSSDQELIQCAPALDTKLTELLYAYYPEGGFYRRHRDAIVGSASILRSFSLLLYINDMEWKQKDGGALRIHLDSGLDSLPVNEEPNYVDVTPNGGTLVLFKSEKIPHEVLDTKATRAAVVGWYNRAVTAADIQNLSSGEGDTMRSAMLLVAAGLVTAGLASIVLG